MSAASILLLAAIKVLAPMPGSGSQVEEATPADLAVFAAADRTLANAAARQALWRDYLRLMGEDESAPAPSAMAFSLRSGASGYVFNVYGELSFDGRFVLEDELPSLVALERLFRDMLGRSRWKDRRFLAAGGGLLFRGFEDPRFAAWDDAVLAACAGSDLPPRILKSVLLETGFAAYGRRPADPAAIAAVVKALAEAGTENGRFVGWYRTLARYRGRIAPAEAGTHHCDDFAGRVMSRDANGEIFVPVLTWK